MCMAKWPWHATGCSFDYEPPNATSGRVRITDVLLRSPGGWRIVHHHEGMAPAGVPPISE